MIGINRETGRALSGLDHIKQSISDIITTPSNSRVMRRDYGCGLFYLIDNPVSPEFKIRAIAEIYKSVSVWESRVKIESVSITTDENRLFIFTDRS